jgi:hypothetical protein
VRVKVAALLHSVGSTLRTSEAVEAFAIRHHFDVDFRQLEVTSVDSVSKAKLRERAVDAPRRNLEQR